MTNYFEQCLADIKGAITDWVDSSLQRRLSIL